jgi:hypothetical protein
MISAIKIIKTMQLTRAGNVIIHMKKQILFRFAVPLLFLGTVGCSNQMSTSLGDRIVNNIDSTIVPVAYNIQAFNGNLPVLGTTSMRDVNDSIPPGLMRNPSSLVVGRFPGLANGADEAIYSYLEFRPSEFHHSGFTSVRSNLKTAFTNNLVDSIVLRLNRVRITSTLGTSLKTVIRARSCAVLKDSVILDTNTLYALSDSTVDATFGVSSDSAGIDSDYSVRLGAPYLERIKKSVRDTGIDTSAFSLCLSPGSTGNGTIRFNNISSDSIQPRVVIYYRASSTATTESSVILYRDHASYSVFESDSSSACTSPLSSWATGRRAVIKLDLSPLKTFMDTAAYDTLKYMVIQKADLNLSILHDSTDIFTDSIQVSLSVFDSLVTNRSQFTTVTSFFVHPAKSDTTTYVLPLAPYLQKILVTSARNDNRVSPAAYLYLMIRTPNLTSPPITQIRWNAASSLKFKAIVTNPR